MNIRFTRQSVMALLIMCGCSSADTDSRVGRHFSESPIQVVWQREIDSADSVLSMPTKLALSDGVIAVLDPTLQRVVGISSADGSDLWVYEHIGAGPGELRGPVEITTDDDGNFVIFDAPGSKLLRLDRAGQFVSEVAAPSAGPRSFCLLSPTSAVVTQLSPGSPLARLDLVKSTLNSMPSPWTVAFPASAATSGDGSSKEITEWARLSQMIVTSVGHERCLVARQTASGIALVSPDSVIWKAASISPPPDDSLRKSVSTAIAIGSVGDTALVAFGGVGKQRGKILDLYDLSSGAYLGSWKTPDHISWLHTRGRDVAVIKNTATGGRISLWHLR